jgi:peptidoglycan/LPS O-acetylase OafA/YrhL
MIYRKDISGLRGLAVISVILFHFDILKNGFLGVDIFFVISGYLITNIIYDDIRKSQFSILQFYLRRIRRIVPLVLFISLICLFTGLMVMLPEDFENLCESIVSTNLFSNNILLLITSVDYWSKANEYKPLMHTWSLGIEEQFYFIYPFIFLFFTGKKIKHIILILFSLTIISLLLFIKSTNNANSFYLLQFRFFELSSGGIALIFFNKCKIKESILTFSLIGIISILFFDFGLNAKLQLLFIVILTLIVLINKKNYNSLKLLDNKMFNYIGKISFSLYMWHQVILAFSRYFIFEKITLIHFPILVTVIFLLSIFTYHFIECPFRDIKRVSNEKLSYFLIIPFILLLGSSLYFFYNAGVIKDVPELDIFKNDIKHNELKYENRLKLNEKKFEFYNERIIKYAYPFSDSNHFKVLIIGNSYARDFANVLLESSLRNNIEIIYLDHLTNTNFVKKNLIKADYIIFSDLDTTDANKFVKEYYILPEKIRNIGIKNFGKNMGLYYNKRFNKQYYNQAIYIDPIYIDRNNLLKAQWGNRYIDIIASLLDNNGKIPIFTNKKKFISHDCFHLTKAGATFLAIKININNIFN